MSAADRLSRPVLGALAVAVGLALTGAPSAPGAEAPPVPPSRPGADLVRDLDRLHARVEIHASFYAGRDAGLYVAEYHPEPPPERWWKGGLRR